MHTFRVRAALLASIFVAAAGSVSCVERPPALTPLDDTTKKPNRTPLPAEVERAMWRVQGDSIVDGSGKAITLQGIAFGNQVWQHTSIPSAHHSGVDYGVVASMGMNSVRFYLSYRSFEDDDAPYRYKDSGWAWLEQNIEWARKYNIRLVLNMHDPVGGYQSLGEGTRLWNDPQMQRRFIALWREIAERYRAEPTIAGFDILNEPVPVQSIAQWQELAERTIKEIRDVDQHHMIFVERANAVGGDWAENADRNFFTVGDKNVVYEFHFYKPYHFTHQNAAWSEFAAREAWYPNEDAPAVDWYQLHTVAVAESEALPPGDSDWTLLETRPFSVYEGDLVVGKPFLVCDRGEGKVRFDTLSLTRVGGGVKKQPNRVGAIAGAGELGKEQAPQLGEEVEERPIETLFEVDLDTRRGWYFWSKNGEGSVQTEKAGHGDATSLSMTHTTDEANLGADTLRFFVEPGNEYTLQGLAKGESLGVDSKCMLRLEFYSSDVKVLPRTRAYLEQELDAYLAFGKKHNVPVYLGEFGTIRDSFLPGRGGLQWVQDMLDLLAEKQVSFAYHDYHESAFGLFIGDDGLPSQWSLYQPLYDALTHSIGGSGRPPWAAEQEAAAAAAADDDDAVSSDHADKASDGAAKSDASPAQDEDKATGANIESFD